MVVRRRPDRRRLALLSLAISAVGVIAWFSLHHRAPEPPSRSAVPGGPEVSTTAEARDDSIADRVTPERTQPLRQGPGRELRGSVTNQSGEPVGGVLVTLNGPGTADYQARSDDHGRFVLADVAPGRYQVIAAGPQLLTYSAFAEFEQGLDPIDLSLPIDQGLPIIGRVFDDHERPVAGARITPLRRGPSSDEYDRRCTVATDASGSFELRGAGTGHTFVLVEHENFAATIARLQPTRAGIVQLRPAK